MTEKRYTVGKQLKVIDDNILKGTFYVCADRAEALKLADKLNEFHNENVRLVKENEQLKQQLDDCKKDEKQLGISFMDYKMQLIEVLQQNYNYAYNQRQKNLDKSIVARTYEMLAQTVYHIAETMNVDIERFPKYEVKLTKPPKCKNCKHLGLDGMFGLICDARGNNKNYDCPKYEEEDGDVE